MRFFGTRYTNFSKRSSVSAYLERQLLSGGAVGCFSAPACSPSARECDVGGCFTGSLAVERLVGKVKWFNDTKGFGFISGNGGQDIFVHHTAIVADGYRSLKEGDSVEFDLETSPKGVRALNVRKVGANVSVLAV